MRRAISVLANGAAKEQQRAYSTTPNNARLTPKSKKTILDIMNKYKNNEPITMVTAYDYTSARLVEKADIDSILVGDSYKMVMAGEDSTVPATMDELIYHTKAVTKGAPSTFVVADMPFGSYETSSVSAVENAVKLIKYGNAQAIKLEGGRRMAERIKAITDAGIPVMGHIGLTPQTASALGGYKVQGSTLEGAEALMADAKALQDAGVYSIVLESVPQKVAELVTKELKVPTIGIGAGVKTSGQILVWHDMLGLYNDVTPKFSKRFGNIGDEITNALEQYREEVQSRSFPTTDHSYKIKQEEWDRIKKVYVVPTKEAAPVQLNQKPAVVVAPSKTLGEVQGLKRDVKSDSGVEIVFSSTKLEPKKISKVAIIGAGAMGSLFASKLSKGFCPATMTEVCIIVSDVWLVSSWLEHIDLINSRGLILEDGDSREINTRVKATSNIDDVPSDVDLIVILVKSSQTDEAALKASALLKRSPNAQILTLQNGLGNFEIIDNIVNSRPGPRVSVIQGVTDQGAYLAGPGVIRRTGLGITTLAGDGASSETMALKELFEASSVATQWLRDSEAVVWGKLVVNAAINPLTALFNLRNGELYNHPQARNLMNQIIDEVVMVAAAKGIELPYRNPHSKVLVESVLKATSGNTSSMLVDVQRGVLTEIEAINGAIVREARRLGVRTPLNEAVLSILRENGSFYSVNSDAAAL